MKGHYLNELSPWHVEDQKIHINSKEFHQEFNILKIKPPSIPKIKPKFHSDFKLEKKSPKTQNILRTSQQIQDVYKRYNQKQQQEKFHQPIINKQTFKNVFSQQQIIKPHRFEALTKINKTNNKQSDQKFTFRKSHKIHSNVLKYNSSKFLIDRENYQVPDYSTLKYKIHTIMKIKQPRLIMNRNKEKLNNSTNRVSGVVFQYVKTMNPFNTQSQSIRPEKKTIKILNPHYLDKLIGKYQ